MTGFRFLILGFAMSGSVALAQTTPAPADPLLGRFHLWVKVGRTHLSDAAAAAWGVDREGYLGLEAYRVDNRGFYLGGEIGGSETASGINRNGQTIRDLGFFSLELNAKRAFNLKRGLTFDAGLGGAFFSVQGEEVRIMSGQESTDPLADLGFGLQAFVDFNWRVRRMLVGLDAKYQWAFDVIDIDYSNLRFGAHLGLAF